MITIKKGKADDETDPEIINDVKISPTKKGEYLLKSIQGGTEHFSGNYYRTREPGCYIIHPQDATVERFQENAFVFSIC